MTPVMCCSSGMLLVCFLFPLTCILQHGTRLSANTSIYLYPSNIGYFIIGSAQSILTMRRPISIFWSWTTADGGERTRVSVALRIFSHINKDTRNRPPDLILACVSFIGMSADAAISLNWIKLQRSQASTNTNIMFYSPSTFMLGKTIFQLI